MLFRAIRILLTVFVLTLGTLTLAGPATAAFIYFPDPTTGLVYRYDDANPAAGVTVTGYDGGPTVTIPDTVTNGPTYDVVAIEELALDAEGLTSVTIGNNITSIGHLAFAGNDITTLNLGTTVTSIGEAAFNANNLTTLTIPDSVTTIGNGAFAQNQLATLTIGDSVVNIGVAAFILNGLTAVSIPSSVTTIGDSTFAGNPGLTDVEFGGPAPTTVTDAGLSGSLGNATGLVVTYQWAYDVSNSAGGFTTPTWRGYDTQTLVPVNFDLQGHGDPIADQDVAAGNTATEPAPPTEPGWTFTGWYTDPGATSAYNFSTPVDDDLTLYAGWTAATNPGTGGGSGNGGGSNDDRILPDTGAPITAPLLAAALAAIGAGLILLRRKA